MVPEELLHAKANESHVFGREKLCIEGNPKPTLPRDLLEPCSRHENDALLRLNLGADRLSVESLFLKELNIGVWDGKS